MTAQEYKKIDDEKKAKERNMKNYHTAAILPYKNKIIAITDNANWYFKLVIYSDFSAGLRCIPGQNNGCQSCSWGGTDILKSHLKHLKSYHKNDESPSIIPDDWLVLEPGFFAALDIK